MPSTFGASQWRPAGTSVQTVPPSEKRTLRAARRDPQRVAAIWEENARPELDDHLPQPDRPTLSKPPIRHRFVPVQYTEDRFIPKSVDPFDESVDRELSMPIPEDVDEISDAIDDEIERRERDSFDLEESEAEEETSDEDSLEELLNTIPPSEETEEDLLDFDLDLNSEDESSGQETTLQQQERLRQQLVEERAASDKNCEEELAKIEADTIRDIDLSIRLEGNAGEDYPFACSLGDRRHEGRAWSEITYNWKASGLCHKPLYFEQVQLERYGHSWGPYLQPIMSGVHFFGTVPVLPYKMGIRTPCECVYTLGYYRPGSCAPYLIDPVPFTWRAALFQAGAATGASFVIP